MSAAVDTKPTEGLGVKASRSQQMVLDAMVTMRRNGTQMATAGDIRELLERTHAPRRFDKGWVTGRLDELRDRGLVERSEETRFNPLTRKASGLWFLPLQQARLCA